MKTIVGRRTVAGCMAVAGAVLAGCGSGEKEETGAASTSASSVGTPATLVRNGQLTVCTDPTYPPMEYYGPDKELTGYDVEAARAVGKAMGLKVGFVPSDFGGILPAMDAGKCDLVWSTTFVNPERTAKFTAVPYQSTGTVILVKAGNPEGIAGPETLSGKTVVSQNGSELLALAQKASDDLEAAGKPGAKIQGYGKFEEAIQQLVVGRADAVVTSDIDAAYRSLRQKGTFETTHRFPDTETIGVYSKPGNKDLIQKLHAALDELQKDGTLKTLAEQQGVPPEGIKVEAPVGG
jgi:polar amino acid transport system substrate-binding protein